MDYLKTAKQHLKGGQRIESAEESQASAQLSQASALIAIGEELRTLNNWLALVADEGRIRVKPITFTSD
jgi:hypothetical protein